MCILTPENFNCNSAYSNAVAFRGSFVGESFYDV